jgi:hypothetical protein
MILLCSYRESVLQFVLVLQKKNAFDDGNRIPPSVEILPTVPPFRLMLVEVCRCNTGCGLSRVLPGAIGDGWRTNAMREGPFVTSTRDAREAWASAVDVTGWLPPRVCAGARGRPVYWGSPQQQL